MKKKVLFAVVAFSTVFVMSSCKSKQRVVSIPSAEVEAIEEAQEPAIIEESMEATDELSIDEKFTLSVGSQNSFDRNYHVVVGSFSIQKNARNLRETLANEGNDAIVVVNENGMFRVIISSYDDYASARNRIAQIRGRFADAWVLRQK